MNKRVLCQFFNIFAVVAGYWPTGAGPGLEGVYRQPPERGGHEGEHCSRGAGRLYVYREGTSYPGQSQQGFFLGNIFVNFLDFSEIIRNSENFALNGLSL